MTAQTTINLTNDIIKASAMRRRFLVMHLLAN